jgi:hypothetical protein
MGRSRERAVLRQHIEAWIGSLSAVELEGFDLETLIGRASQASLVSVSQSERENGVFANVDAVLKLPKGMKAPKLDGSYVRHVDRSPVSQPRPVAKPLPGPVVSRPPAADEDMPDDADIPDEDNDAYEEEA